MLSAGAETGACLRSLRALHQAKSRVERVAVADGNDGFAWPSVVVALVNACTEAKALLNSAFCE